MQPRRAWLGLGLLTLLGFATWAPAQTPYPPKGTLQNQPLPPAATEEGDPRLARLLRAVGLPNDQGEIRWPLALRVAPPGPKSQELRQQIEAFVQASALQEVRPPLSHALAEEASRAVDALRRLMRTERAERGTLREEAYQEAERFLDQLSFTARVLAAESLPAPTEGRLTTEVDKKTMEIVLDDNRFEPKVLTVAPGTEVRWVNKGRHAHTVTADDGSWGSGELAAGQGFSHTFTRPGTYSYHCRVHPAAMRGSVTVK